MADPILSLTRSLAQRIEVCIVPVAEDTALFQCKRRIILQSVAQFLSEPRHFANGVLQKPRKRSLAEVTDLSDVRGVPATASRLRCRPAKLNPINQFTKLTLQRRDLLERGL